MKTVLRILTVLLIGSLVAGGVYLLVQNSALASDTRVTPSIDRMPASTTGEVSQLPTRPEGDFDNSASFTRGLSEVGVTLAKLTGITLLVLLIQFLLARLTRRREIRPMLG